METELLILSSCMVFCYCSFAYQLEDNFASALNENRHTLWVCLLDINEEDYFIFRAMKYL